MIRSHPTTYADVRFRSRLEARWAAFFDLAGWKWEYEPLDLKGWVPDFVLKGDSANRGSSVLVTICTPTGGGMAWFSILGAYLPPSTNAWGDNTPMLGYLVDGGVNRPLGYGMGVLPAALFGGTGGRKFDFAATICLTNYFMGGEYAGEEHLIHLNDSRNDRTGAKSRRHGVRRGIAFSGVRPARLAETADGFPYLDKKWRPVGRHLGSFVTWEPWEA